MQPEGIREALLAAGGAPAKEMMESITLLGEAAVLPLLQVATDRALWNEDSPGSGEAPANAVTLLGALRTAAAVDPSLAS